MPRMPYRPRDGYRRLPRTIVITVLGLPLLVTLVVTVGGFLRNNRSLQEAYLARAARLAEFEATYQERSRVDRETGQIFEEDIPGLKEQARMAEASGEADQVASLSAMADVAKQEAERCRGESRTKARVAAYLATMQDRYRLAAVRPWREPPTRPEMPPDVYRALVAEPGGVFWELMTDPTP